MLQRNWFDSGWPLTGNFGGGTDFPLSQYVDQDGKRLEPFGPNPKGIVVYDSNGRFVLVLQRASLPRFASSNRMAGSAEENKAIVQGSIAYFGS